MLISFDSIKCQEKAKHLLGTAIRKNRTSHAYLFKGPAGVGKKMTAHGLAALLNCQASQAMRVCGTCPSCKKFDSDNHPDFQLIKPQGAGIKIGQIRELQKNLAFSPFEAKTRVILLPDIHDTMRRPEVANALLKTLEEPPDDTMLILTGDEAGHILPTILSRCQVIPFTPLLHEDVADLLEHASKQQAMTLAAIAEGSPGRASQQEQQGFLEIRKTNIETLTNTDKNSSQLVSRVYTMAQQGAELKDNAEELLDLLTSWLRDLIVLKSKSPQTIHLINQDLHNLAETAEHWSTAALMQCFNAIATARQQLNRNCNRTLVFEVLFFALLDEKW
ncbi:MAG: DNA polymerase III subunit delta' [Spirochaetales bacterium]|jgi:DNA polymerase-3 subunit delta'|nr:DNA polymerase III subunit delta' [Spirochaetales bacterium]